MVGPAPIRLELIRGFSLTCQGMRVALPLSAQRLLAFTALQRRPVPRAKVATTLWQEGTEERCGANLRSALWRLRRPHCDLVEAVGTSLRLSSHVAVDVHEAEARARRLAGLGRYADAVEAAMAAVRGEPLRESAHRTLIGVHLAEGNRHRALCQYHEYCQLMRSELDLDPSPPITELVADLMR